MKRAVVFIAALVLVGLALPMLYQQFDSHPPSPVAGEVDTEGLAALIQDAGERPVLVSFWATWCQPCLEEMRELIKLRESFPEEQLLIVGLSVDNAPDALDTFFAKRTVNYPIYWAGTDVARSQQVTSIPKLVLYDAAGKKVWEQVGALPLSTLRQIVGMHVAQK